jgi:hypothetical protein
MLRRLGLVCPMLLGLAACGDDDPSRLASFSSLRPPSADAVLLFVSGSWAGVPGAPRELYALNADGSVAERLTACGQAAQPCDFLQVAPGPERDRVMTVRTTPGAADGASALYYLDLSRGLSSPILPARRVGSVDYARSGGFLVYSSAVAQTGLEDIFSATPNGTDETNLSQTIDARERNPRIDPTNSAAVYERADAGGMSRIHVVPGGAALTSGPATGEPLAGTPYLVGGDADPVFSPESTSFAFRRLTGTGNGGLGTWDLVVAKGNDLANPRVLVTGPLHRGAPEWGPRGILFVETDAATSRSELVLVQADGSGRTVLRTEDAGYRMGSPRWLPAN